MKYKKFNKMNKMKWNEFLKTRHFLVDVHVIFRLLWLCQHFYKGTGIHQALLSHFSFWQVFKM